MSHLGRAAFLAFALLPWIASAQEPPRGGPPKPGMVTPVKGDRIQWFGTWKGGLAEAQRTQRPIFLISAAPECHSVPGIW